MNQQPFNTLVYDRGNLALGDDLLIFRYPAGDYDTIPAIPYDQLVERDWAWKLAICLFNARECSEEHFDDVFMPCGHRFDIEAEYDKHNAGNRYDELKVGWWY